MKIINYKSQKVSWMVRYNERKLTNHAASRIGGNVAGSTETVERVFKHVGQARDSANLKNRYMHIKISLSPGDQHITSATFRKITSKVLEGLGLNDNAHIIYRHYDTLHPHVHVVVSRIKYDGTLVRDSFDGMRLKRIERELAGEFNLTPSFSRLLTPAGIRLPQKWEEKRMETSGTKSARNYVQNAVIEAIQNQPSLAMFVARLERRGVKVFHREVVRSGKIYHGLSYTLAPSLLDMTFRHLNRTVVPGIDEEEALQLSDGRVEKVKHKYFGSIAGRILYNARGIKEFCINGSMPDNNPRPFSFRASNLGPFFQYSSIMAMLSSVEAETLTAITIPTKSGKKPLKEDYQRDAIFKVDPMLNKLLYAAELRSIEGLQEASAEVKSLDDLVRWTKIIHKTELEFIDHHRLSISLNTAMSNAQQMDDGIDNTKSLMTRYLALTSSQPNSNTIIAIRLIADKNWDELTNMLIHCMAKRERQDAPHPAITYLGIARSMALLALDYQNWHKNEAALHLEPGGEKESERKSDMHSLSTLLESEHQRSEVRNNLTLNKMNTLETRQDNSDKRQEQIPTRGINLA